MSPSALLYEANPPRIGEPPPLSKVEDYKILTAYNEGDLRTHVKAHIHCGFEPLGGVSMAIYPAHPGAMQLLYAQAMIKYIN